MDIGEILTVSIRKIWKFKVFWLLGALPFVFYGLYLPVSQLTSPFSEVLLPGLFEVLEIWQVELASAFLSLVVTLLNIPLFILGFVAVTVGTLRAENTEAGLSFGELLQAGLRFFWRALGVRAIFVLGLMAVMIPFVFVGFIISALTMGLGALCMFPLFFLFIPISYAVYALMEMAESAVVADDLSVMVAISNTWALVRENFWRLVLLGVIIYLGAGLAATIVLFPLLLPLYLPLFSLGMGDGFATREMILVSTACLCVSMPLYVLLQGVLLALQKITWTQTYLALTRKPVEAASIEVFDVN